MPQVRHARRRGVRQFHSTEETGEQQQRAAARGVGGGKGTDQGERQAVPPGPDTAPDTQDAWGCSRVR